MTGQMGHTGHQVINALLGSARGGGAHARQPTIFCIVLCINEIYNPIPKP